MEQSPDGSNFSIERVRNQLAACFAVYRTPDADKVQALLAEPLAPFDDQACLDRVGELITGMRDEQVANLKAEFNVRVQQTYPAGPDDTPPLKSPNRFLKRNGLDSSFRPQLRQAQADTIDTSRARLIDTIAADTSHEGYTAAVDDTRVLEDLHTYRQGLMDEVKNTSEAISALLPTGPWLHSSTLEKTAIVLGVRIPEDAKEVRALNSALLKLRTTLAMLKQDEGAIAETISQKYLPNIVSHITEQLIEQYEGVELDFLRVLPTELEAAYRQAVQTGQLYRPTPKPVDVLPLPVVDEDLDSTTETTSEVIKLGEITSPFPWLKDQTVNIHFLRHNGNSILFCEAMSPAATSISQELRARKQYGDELDRLWNRVKDVESSGNEAAQGYSQRAFGVSDEAYKNVSVLYYGNIGPNARRIYYVKTNMEKYEPVQQLAMDAGLEAQLPLLILIGETDKANQLKLLGTLGISRQEAKAHGAGSI